jgi:hypothetical protein
MKHFSIIITSFFLVSCSSSSQDRTSSNNDSITLTPNQSTEFKETILDPCETTSIRLDTTTELQNQFFEPEKDLLDYKMVAVHATNGNGEMGYVVFSKNERLTLCLVDWKDGYKIIGATNIPNLRNNETFVDFCKSSCKDNFKTFGVVEEVKYGDVKTIRAWRVNDILRQLEEINPTSVNCTESFYTEYD